MCDLVGMIWCPHCRSKTTPPPARSAPKPPDELFPTGAFSWLDQGSLTWIGALLGGVILIFLGSLVIGLQLTGHPKLQAAWTFTQLGAGLIALVLVQIACVPLLGLQDEPFGLFDLIFSGRIWTGLFSRMPATRWPIAVGAWCAAFSIAAVVCVGGLEHWLPPGKVARTKPKHAANLEEIEANPAVAAKDAAEKKDKDKEKDKDVPKTVSRCVIAGYIGEDVITGLVLATVEGKEVWHAGTIPVNLTREQSRRLRQDLAPSRLTKPIFADLSKEGINWVRPKFPCEVEHTGFDKDGIVKDATVKTLGADQTPVAPPEKNGPSGVGEKKE
jgi:hypothetical protein